MKETLARTKERKQQVVKTKIKEKGLVCILFIFYLEFASKINFKVVIILLLLFFSTEIWYEEFAK